jgi:hypothetical protein
MIRQKTQYESETRRKPTTFQGNHVQSPKYLYHG